MAAHGSLDGQELTDAEDVRWRGVYAGHDLAVEARLEARHFGDDDPADA